VVKIGFSLKSCDKARENLCQTAKGSFDEVVRKTRDVWNQHLGRIRVAGASNAQIAKGVGNSMFYDELMKNAQNWRNAYDPETGLLIDSEYYEGGKWNYSFRLIHDMAGRIALCGHPDSFIEKLDLFFGFKQPPTGRRLQTFGGLNNQADMESPYAYHYAGRPDKTADVVHTVLNYQYSQGRGGLPGNDDSGGTSFWYVWSAIGLFPVTGQDVFLINSPLFKETILAVNESEFKILAINISEKNIYVKKAILNGIELNRAYLRFSDLSKGGTLELMMAAQPTDWGHTKLAPSYP
jgi:putative alpha-1,2-mannosidase